MNQEDFDEESDIFGQEIIEKMKIRGKVLHFIPSEQMKIIKGERKQKPKRTLLHIKFSNADIQNERDVKPVFLRKFIFGSGILYPHFNFEEELKDTQV
jgi:hypothetical protein